MGVCPREPPERTATPAAASQVYADPRSNGKTTAQIVGDSSQFSYGGENVGYPVTLATPFGASCFM
jgi:hypothetical protein